MTMRGSLVTALSLLLPVGVLAAGPAHATLKDAQGKEVGAATFTAGEGGVKLAVEVHGLPPGPHGIHVHGVGKCEAPEFKSAGPHFNPSQKKHGLENPAGHHEGDMPNLTVGPDGKGKLQATLDGVTLGAGSRSLFGPEGTALVVHADPDDEKTDPAGNSGARIACGVVQR
jgi:Cu-Zn family superoxide dismutase